MTNTKPGSVKVRERKKEGNETDLPLSLASPLLSTDTVLIRFIIRVHTSNVRI